MKEKVKRLNEIWLIKQLRKGITFKYWFSWSVISIFLTFFIEVVHRFSVTDGIDFVKQYPFATYLNFAIVSGTLVTMLMTSRRWLVALAWSTFWLILSFGNGVITESRGTPLMFSDFFLISEGLSIAGSYLSPPLIIALIVVLIGLLIAMIKLFQLKKQATLLDYCFSAGYLTLMGVTLYLAATKSWLVPINWDYMTSYQQQGFPYSFVNTIYPYLEQGVEGYSKGAITEIKDAFVHIEEDSHQPNVIYLQLESFMDPLEFEGVEYTFDPIPTFRALFEAHGGYLKVPTFGGGTVRTEFEVLTGMDLDLMKPGEIPNNQLLRAKEVESLASSFREKGYSSTAIHNFQGTFYNRDTVYENLGFNIFIPLEYMTQSKEIQYTNQTDGGPLIDYIVKSIEATPEQSDFIFAVTTGPHGPYEYQESYATNPLQVTKLENESHHGAVLDMAIRYHALDNELKRLIEYIDTLEEETILVAYSDHLPSAPILNDDKHYKKTDKYVAPYVIYSNFELNDLDAPEELEAYQLSSYVYDLIGMKGGIMNDVHRTFNGTEDYLRVKELVQHDLLVGKSYLYDKELITTDIQLGLDVISITEVLIENGQLVLNGENLNPYTHIWINGEKVKPILNSTEQLIIDLMAVKGTPQTLEAIETLEMAQVGRYDKRMGELISISINHN